MYFLAWRDITVRYKQTVIGVAWALIRPALTMVVFVLFRRLAGIEHAPVPDVLLVLSAVIPWQFFANAVADSSSSLINNTNLISKVYFPRLIVPVSAVVTALVDLLITLAMLAVVMAWQRFTPGPQLLLLPLFVVLACALSTGLGLFLAALNVEYRDFRYVVPFMIQIGLFVSPIAFTTVEHSGALDAAVCAEPVGRRDRRVSLVDPWRPGAAGSVSADAVGPDHGRLPGVRRVVLPADGTPLRRC